MASLVRVSVSLPPEVVDDLDYLAGRLHVSRSALVAQLLLWAELPSFRSLLSNLPETPSDGDVRRFRGDSREFVEQTLKRLQGLQGGLFDDQD